MFRKLAEWNQELIKTHQIGLFKQFTDIVRYKKTCGIGISEYYELGLFERDKYPAIDRCIGRKRSAYIDLLLNRTGWRATANNKILNYSLLSYYGLSIPLTVATYKSKGAKVGDEAVIDDAEALHQFFSITNNYPLFVKPVMGSCGRCTFSLASYDPQSRIFQNSVGGETALSEILSVAEDPRLYGLLIQSVLQQHSNLVKAVGSSVSCVRIIVVKDDDDIFIQSAFWKIARKHNFTDNFSYGKNGNLLADLDIKTGRVKRLIAGLWPNTGNLDSHPDTQYPLMNFQLPDWQKAIDLCIRASKIFPGLALQSWDVVFCQQGPVLMELNTEPNLEVPQMLSESHFLDDRLMSVLLKRGWQ